MFLRMLVVEEEQAEEVGDEQEVRGGGVRKITVGVTGLGGGVRCCILTGPF